MKLQDSTPPPASPVAAVARRVGGTLPTLLPSLLPPVIVVTIGAWVMITYSVAQWRTMQVPSWDLAIFSELAKAYSRFEALD